MIYEGNLLPDDYGQELTAAVYIRLHRAAEKQTEERSMAFQQLQAAQRAVTTAEATYRHHIGLDDDAQIELAHYTRAIEEE